MLMEMLSRKGLWNTFGFGAWCLVLGLRCSVLGAWCSALGARCVALGARIWGPWCTVFWDMGVYIDFWLWAPLVPLVASFWVHEGIAFFVWAFRGQCSVVQWNVTLQRRNAAQCKVMADSTNKRVILKHLQPACQRFVWKDLVTGLLQIRSSASTSIES